MSHEEQIRGGRVWLPLGRFVDSIRARADSSLQFIVDIWDEAGRHVVVAAPVLVVTQALSISELIIADQSLIDSGRDTRRLLRFQWKQTHPVTNRELRIWSLTRLWEQPVPLPIPDDARDCAVLQISTDQLPAGRYRVEMVIADPWAVDASQSGYPYAPSYDGVERRAHLDDDIGTPDELLAYLQQHATDIETLIDQVLLSDRFDTLRALPGLIDADSNLYRSLIILESLLAANDADVLLDENALEAVIMQLRDGLVRQPHLVESLIDYSAQSSDANRLGTGQQDARWRAIRLAASLGIPQMKYSVVVEHLAHVDGGSRQRVEQLFPMLMVADLDDSVRALAARRVEAETLFGQVGILSLLPELTEDGDDTEFEVKPTLTSDQRRAILSRFGRSILPRDYELPMAQLQYIRDYRNLVPQGLLDDDAFDVAMFDWLIPLAQDRNRSYRAVVEDWLNQTDPIAQRFFQRLEDHLRDHSDDEIGLVLSHELMARRITGSHLGVARVPFVVGTGALIQRLLARRPGIATELAARENRALDWGRMCARVAPALYLHDLCLIDLILLRRGQSGLLRFERE